MGLFNDSLPTRRDNSLSTFRRDMRDFFDRFDLGANDLSPRVEFQEKDNLYYVSAEIPGIKENDLNIFLRDNALVLEGERKSEVTDEEEGYYSSEFSYGKFYRTIPLRDEVNPETVKASYQNGILKVELEKVATTSHKEKKIEINKKTA